MMESWIFFVFIAQVIWAICCIIDKVVISKGYVRNPIVYVMVNAMMNVLLLFLIPFIEISSLGALNTVIAIASGFALSLGVTIYYKAVEYDEISKIRLMDQAGPIIVFILSFFLLGERLSSNQAIGFCLLLLAGIVVSVSHYCGKFRFSKAYLLILGSAVLGAIGAVSAKHIYSTTTFWNAFFWLRIGQLSTLLALIYHPLRKDAIKTYKSMKLSGKKILGFKMIIDFCAFIFVGIAVLNGPISLVSTLNSTLGPLLVFIFAVIASRIFPELIKETIDLKSILIKIASAILVVAGIIFINL